MQISSLQPHSGTYDSNSESLVYTALVVKFPVSFFFFLFCEKSVYATNTATLSHTEGLLLGYNLL